MSGVTPIYLYRRHGQQAWATCHLERFEELRELAIFSTMIAYSETDYDKLACLVEAGHKLSMDAACGEIAELEAERDELRAQVEAMRAQVDGLKDVLAGAYAWMEDATSKVLYPIALHETGRVAMEAEGLGSCTPDLFKSIDAALQAKP